MKILTNELSWCKQYLAQYKQYMIYEIDVQTTIGFADNLIKLLCMDKEDTLWRSMRIYFELDASEERGYFK